MQAQSISVGGAAITYAAPAASDTVPMGSLLHVKNGAAAAITVTLTVGKTLETGDPWPNKQVSVPAGGDLAIPVALDAYRPADGTSAVQVTFSAVASITAAAIARW